MDPDRRFRRAVALMVQMEAEHSLDFLTDEVRSMHYKQLRAMLEKRCRDCKNLFCSLTGTERLFCTPSPSASPNIIE